VLLIFFADGLNNGRVSGFEHLLMGVLVPKLLGRLEIGKQCRRVHCPSNLWLPGKGRSAANFFVEGSKFNSDDYNCHSPTFFDQERVINLPSNNEHAIASANNNLAEIANDLPASADNNGLAEMINKVHVPACADDNSLANYLGVSAGGLAKISHDEHAEGANNGNN
jgi:hypothetical protein